jgi:hypothetical protein
MLNRRLNLIDAMILISAVATGLVSARWWYGQPGYVSPSAIDVQSASEMIDWLLLPMTFALLAIRLSKPRPRCRRLVRQPGLQANLVICLAIASALLNGRWGYKPHWSSLPLGIGVEQVSLVGPMLAAGWILTALARSRRPEPSVIDRLGRVVGWAWIVLWVDRSLLAGDSLMRMWLAF